MEALTTQLSQLTLNPLLKSKYIYLELQRHEVQHQVHALSVSAFVLHLLFGRAIYIANRASMTLTPMLSTVVLLTQQCVAGENKTSATYQRKTPPSCMLSV